MIVRDANGETTVISDRYRNRVRKEGIDSVESEISNEQHKIIQVTPGEAKKSSMGSLLYSTTPYGDGEGEDDTDLDYEQRKKIRDLPLKNPLAYSYVFDPPLEAIYQTSPLRIKKFEWQESDDGVNAIIEWMRLFESIRGNPKLMWIGIWAAQYFRQNGETVGEFGYLKNDYLHLLGYKDDQMINRIDLISPVTLNDVGYNKTTGRLKFLELEDRNGQLKQFRNKELEKFIYFHNMPKNERRGVTRLRPTRRWFAGFDDLLEYNLEMYYQDARPIEEHIMDSEGLLPEERKDLWTDHKAEVNASIDKKTRMLMHDKKIALVLNGFQGRTLDSAPMLDKTKGYIHQGSRIPEAFVEAKNANKATIDVQERHWQNAQLTPVDRATAMRFLCEEIFPLVLETRGVDLDLVPYIQFPPFRTSDMLEQAATWQVEVETFGDERRKQIAEEQGFAYDQVLIKEEPAKSEDLKSILLRRNVGS